jgi:hypothetical protein
VDEKTAVVIQNKPRRRCHDDSVIPIKNSNPGNRMAGEMKERPGNMGSRRLFGAFLAVQKGTQPVKAVDKKIGFHFYLLGLHLRPQSTG